MARRARVWTCKRQKNGVKCGGKNPSQKRNCVWCGKPRPARKKPEHARILLELAYEEWEKQFGNTCNICGAEAKKIRLSRDHDHRTGAARGLLCVRCNRALPSWIDAEWLRKAAEYLERPAFNP